MKGSTAETAQKRLERPWTAARTMEVLRRCPLAIAQRLVHCTIAVSTAVLDRVTKTMSVAPLLMQDINHIFHFFSFWQWQVGNTSPCGHHKIGGIRVGDQLTSIESIRRE